MEKKDNINRRKNKGRKKKRGKLNKWKRNEMASEGKRVDDTNRKGKREEK